MTDFTFELHATDIDKEAFDEIKRLDAEKVALINALKQKLIKHQRYIAAKDLLGTTDYGMPRSMVPGWNGRGFTIAVSMDRVKNPSSQSKPRRELTYVDPKTLNALLHGKLLTDAEKRKLVAQVLPEGVLADAATS